MQYNEEQQALIDAPIDEIVIGASAAGSGKSTTLVGRARKDPQKLSFRKCYAHFIHSKCSR